MKIHGLDPAALASQKTPTGSISTGVDFQELLRAQLEKTAPPEATASVEKTNPTRTAPASLRVEGLTLTEASLSTLEAFSTALGNPGIAAEELQPFISNLEEETLALLAVRKQLGDEDPLTAVLDRVAALTYVETAKYHRGDYAV